MKKFFNEFKEFALRGNVMNLAIGVIIGAAFQSVVTSLTDNIISPVIGLFTQQNFDMLVIEVFGVTIKYGAFITAVINFVITALVIFIIVRIMNRLVALGKRGKADEPPETKKCPFCCTDIPYAAVRCPNCTAELAPAPEHTAS